jgi:hypothetical protein
MSSSTTQTTALQDKLNSPALGKFADALALAPVGDILAVLLAAATATETGLSASGNKGALGQAPTPNGLFQVNATTATHAGVKQIVTDPTATLITGQVYWDGGVNLTFAAVDGVTAFSALYCKGDGSVKVSSLLQIVSP